MTIYNGDTSGNLWPIPGNCLAGEMIGLLLSLLRRYRNDPAIVPR